MSNIELMSMVIDKSNELWTKYLHGEVTEDKYNLEADNIEYMKKVIFLDKVEDNWGLFINV